MEWLYLALAGVMEITWSVAMKSSNGFTKLIPSIITVVGLIASMGLLALALRKLPLSVAYAVWTGIGIVRSTLVGILFFHEPVNVVKIICIVLIAGGIVGLKFA